MRTLTASSLDAAALCIGSATLDGFAETHAYSGAGTAAHRFLEVARTDRTRALQEAPEEDRDFFACFDLAAIPAGLSSEVALAYHPERDEGRILDVEGRKYPSEAGWLYGTADLLGVADGRIICPDLKRYQAPRSARSSLQLRFYALAAARAKGIEAATVSFLVPRPDGRWYVDAADLDAMDLDATRDEIRALVTKRDRAVASIERNEAIPLHVGAHCTYCPARRACPAHTALIRIAASGDVRGLIAQTDGMSQAGAVAAYKATVAGQLAALTPEEIGQAWHRIGPLFRFLEGARDAIREMAAVAAIPLGDGKELREIATTQWATTAAGKELQAQLKKEMEASGDRYKVAGAQVRAVKEKR